MADSAKRMEISLTYRDYLNFPDDRQKYEILEGELYMTPSPNYLHQKISQSLEYFLYSHIRQHRRGILLHAPMDVIINESTVVQPDILFVREERRTIITDRGVEGAPDLVVEILSPSTASLDRLSKFQIYGKLGVCWYWIVDPGLRQIEQYENEHGVFVHRGTWKNDDKLKAELFDGLELDLREIFL
jgi:Uma2 family endonuclease